MEGKGELTVETCCLPPEEDARDDKVPSQRVQKEVDAQVMVGDSGHGTRNLAGDSSQNFRPPILPPKIRDKVQV